MKGTFELKDVDEMEATMTVTMKIREWKCISKELIKTVPSMRFSQMIDYMVGQANKTFYGSDEITR